ncbi:hypothetical protein FJY93_00715 [Candidatus Kaiserbacteria bacterium]|nr:hypothetical protein [Candidatus Kaiserbacteria bacterium]
MNIITIPQRIISNDDLVIIPRKEYEALKARPVVAEFAPSSAQVRTLSRARKHFKEGKTISYDEIVKRVAARGR